MNKYIKIGLVVLACVCVLVIGVVYSLSKNNSSVKSSETATRSTNLNIKYESNELNNDIGNYSAKINLSDSNTSIEGAGVTSSDSTITITKAGVYYVTGTLSDGNIVVLADKSDDVQIVLDNVNLTSSTTAPINCVKAGKLTVTLADGSINTLTDSSSYTVFTDTEKSEPDATVFSKSDLVINGNGKLVVNSKYSDGIASKDGLKIINAVVEINSADDGIRGKDYVAIKDANIKVSSTGDSIRSKGSVVIDGDTLELSSGDDGIHADTDIVINDGTINIVKSYEGIESDYIEINGGTISIVASDDGINISGGKDGSAMMRRPGEDSSDSVESAERKLVINGGDITVKATGDGIDANGSIYINGGSIVVVGTTDNFNGALDYDKEMVVTGGSLISYGSTGMWQNPSSSSTQYSLAFNVSGKTGDVIVLKDNSNNEIVSTTTGNSYSAIVFSNPKIKNGETYTIYVNGTSSGSLTVSSSVTSNVLSSGPMGGGRMGGNFDPNNMPEDFDPENMPKNFDRGNMPKEFNRENMPEDFDPSQMRPQGKKGDFKFSKENN